MMRPSWTALSLILVPWSTGCAHVGRDAATELSASGQHASSALAADVQVRAERLRGQARAQDFVATYPVLRLCGPGMITRGAGADPQCDVARLAKARAISPVAPALAGLASIIELRGNAIAALGGAYAAFGDEARFDAAGEVEQSIGAATSAVNAFAVAVGIPPLGAAVSEGAKLAGRALAARAQQRRLLSASRRIAVVTHRMRVALEAERTKFAEVDALIGDLDDETRSTLLAAGLVDPASEIRAIALGAGLPPPDEATIAAAIKADPAVGAAGTIATLRADRSPGLGDLDAGIRLLDALERQHTRFEAGEPLRAEELAAAADRLATLVAAIKR